ncbi:MAG: hypothetical protein QM564_08920 [Bergeyella sp.]
MISENILSHIQAYKDNNQIIDAVEYLLRSYRMEDENLSGFEFRDDWQPGFVVITTEGDFGKPQIIRLPQNLFDCDLRLVLNLIAHEMVHVRQKTQIPFVEDKNEREWQAYYEMLFHQIFPHIPDASDFHRKGFAEKALEYYRKMGEDSELQQKYAEQKAEVEQLLDEILIKRGEK